VSQQFNGEVEQVAGNDIINKNNIFNIHLPAATENKPDPELKRAVHILLKTCEEANCKAAVEKISKSLFDKTSFKGLTINQLEKLQFIADEIRSALQNKALKDESQHAVFTQEMDEYENFHSRIGVRASKLERLALTELMVTCPINPKQIKLAWSNSILFYEDNQLRIKLPVLELWIGTALALVSGIELYLIMMQMVLVKPPIQQLVQQGPAILVFVSALIGSTRFMIAPAYVGKRIKAAIEKTD
jgi:hypothetical protein